MFAKILFFKNTPTVTIADGETGLTDEQVAQQHKKYGTNRINYITTSFSTTLLQRLYSPLAAGYAVLLAILYYQHDTAQVIITGVACLCALIIETIQRYIHSKHRASVIYRPHYTYRTLRNGSWHQLHADDLVPQDLIEITINQQVPAKCLVLTTDSAQISDKDTAYGAQEGTVLYAGSTVTHGSAIARILSTRQTVYCVPQPHHNHQASTPHTIALYGVLAATAGLVSLLIVKAPHLGAHILTLFTLGLVLLPKALPLAVHTLSFTTLSLLEKIGICMRSPEALYQVAASRLIVLTDTLSHEELTRNHTALIKEIRQQRTLIMYLSTHSNADATEIARTIGLISMRQQALNAQEIQHIDFDDAVELYHTLLKNPVIADITPALQEQFLAKLTRFYPDLVLFNDESEACSDLAGVAISSANAPTNIVQQATITCKTIQLGIISFLRRKAENCARLLELLRQAAWSSALTESAVISLLMLKTAQPLSTPQLIIFDIIGSQLLLVVIASALSYTPDRLLKPVPRIQKLVEFVIDVTAVTSCCVFFWLHATNIHFMNDAAARTALMIILLCTSMIESLFVLPWRALPKNKRYFYSLAILSCALVPMLLVLHPSTASWLYCSPLTSKQLLLVMFWCCPLIIFKTIHHSYTKT